MQRRLAANPFGASRLKVYEIENLRIADASIMPRIPTGNTMAPCVIIGERAADMLKAARNLSGSEASSSLALASH